MKHINVYNANMVHFLRRFNSKEEFMKQRKINYANYYKKYKIWFDINMENKFISYVNYSNDFLMDIIGFKKYALQVRKEINIYIKNNLHLNVSKNEYVNRNKSHVTFLDHIIK